MTINDIIKGIPLERLVEMCEAERHKKTPGDADEIVMRLRNNCADDLNVIRDMQNAADLIERLQVQSEQRYRLYSGALDTIERLEAQLAASQARERAAVEDMTAMHNCGAGCKFCRRLNQCSETYSKIGFCEDFEWRGPQAGEGTK